MWYDIIYFHSEVNHPLPDLKSFPVKGYTCIFKARDKLYDKGLRLVDNLF